MQNQHHDDQQDHHAHFEHTGMYDYEAILHSQRITWDDLKAHLLGPVISIVVHIILLVSVCSMTLFEGAKEADDVSVDSKTMEVKAIEEPPPPPEVEEVEVETVEIEMERPVINATMETEVVENMNVSESNTNFEMPELAIVMTNSALKIETIGGVYDNRSNAGIAKSVATYGGEAGKRTLPAVNKALSWLASVQNPDGSWGKEHKAALSSLVTLAFLAHGDTHESEKYGETMLKAFQALVKLEELATKTKALNSGHNVYSSAMLGYALSESYGMTKMPALKIAMNSRMKQIIDGMDENGSYGYGYPAPKKTDGSVRSDLSVAGWHYQAMKAAYIAGCDVEGLEKAMEKGVKKGLKKIHFMKASNTFNYDSTIPQGTQSMTCVGTLCLQLLGEGSSKEAKAAFKTIETNKEWYNTCSLKQTTVPWAYYIWYYQTQVLFQGNEGKGGAWTTWNKVFTNGFLKGQHPDGYFDHPEMADGKRALEKETIKGELDGRLYCTALATLSMEVYYRFLPTFKLVHGADSKTLDSVRTEDLEIKIE